LGVVLSIADIVLALIILVIVGAVVVMALRDFFSA